jgi:hypothetical protein
MSQAKTDPQLICPSQNVTKALLVTGRHQPLSLQPDRTRSETWEPEGKMKRTKQCKNGAG